MTASEMELDLYNELTNIGGGNAATALSQMLARKVQIGLPRSAELSLTDVSQVVGEGDGLVAVVLLTVRGELEGSVALVLDEPQLLLDALSVPPEFAESALSEIGNIVVARFLISMGDMCGLRGDVEPPAVAFAPRMAALQTVVALAATSEPFTAMRMEFAVEDADEAELIYFPCEGAVERMRGLLG